jgi:CPA1 family monovalent cation:H+ antiporter
MLPTLHIVIELLLIAVIAALLIKRLDQPYTIGLVVVGLILGVLQFFEPIPLSKELVLTLFLPPLLFEGALHIRFDVLRKRWPIISGLSLVGTLVTTSIIGAAAHYLLGMSWPMGLLMGAIVAPTDPVSVLATFKEAGTDRELSTLVESESLFNDGVAVVLYTVLLAVVGGESISIGTGMLDFAIVAGGGLAIGFIVGTLANPLLRRLDDYLIEVMVTIVIAYGTFLLAESLHLSGVLAVAVAGLAVGNCPFVCEVPPEQTSEVIIFWEVAVFLLNTILFLLMGFALHPTHFLEDVVAALTVVAAMIISRAIMSYGLGAIGVSRERLPWSWVHVMFWGGLRGSIPIALALGLPLVLPGRDDFISVVFGVVLFSLIVQGLTIPYLLKRLRLVGAAEA